MATKRKFSDAFEMNARIKSGKFSSNIEYMGGKIGTMNKENYFREIAHETYTFFSLQKRVSPIWQDAHKVRWNSDYEINKHHQLGFEYYYQFMDKNTKDIGSDMQKYADFSTNKNIYRNKDNLSNLHSLTFVYNYKKNKNSFQVIQDMAISNSKSKHLIEENENENNRQILTKGNDRYLLSTSNIRYNTSLPWKIGFSAGLKYVMVSSDGLTESDNPYIMNGNYRITNEVIEHNPQAYVAFVRKIGKITIRPAVRYQYMYRNIKSILGTEIPEVVKQNYSSLFPSLSVTYAPNKNTSFYFRYNRIISQPNFSELNSGLVYLDSLSYNVGNSNLCASHSNHLIFGGTWKEFSFSAKYNYEKDPIVTIENPISSESNIIVTNAVNLKSQQDFRVNIGYTNTFSKLNLHLEGEAVFPSGKYSYLNQYYNADKISFNGNLNISYKISPNFGIFTSFSYQRYKTRLLMSQKPANNWSIGLVGSFLKNRLSLNVLVSDILKGANYNNLVNRYGCVKSGTYGTNDLRGIMVNISYSIWCKDIKVKTKRENSDIIQRIN